MLDSACDHQRLVPMIGSQRRLLSRGNVGLRHNCSLFRNYLDSLELISIPTPLRFV